MLQPPVSVLNRVDLLNWTSNILKVIYFFVLTGAVGDVTTWHKVRPKDKICETHLVLHFLQAAFMVLDSVLGSVDNRTKPGISYGQRFVLSWVGGHVKDEWWVMYYVIM